MRVAVSCKLEPDFIEANFPSIPATGDVIISDKYGEFVAAGVAWFLDDDMNAAPRLELTGIDE